MAESSYVAGGGRGRKRARLDEKESELPRSINLKVKGQDGREIHFKMRRDTKMKKLLKDYCRRFQVDYKTVHFYYDGERFPVLETPDELHMEDGDEIEAMVPCGGGGSAAIA